MKTHDKVGLSKLYALPLHARTGVKAGAKKLFVGGLSFNTTEDGLREGFTLFGDTSGTVEADIQTPGAV